MAKIDDRQITHLICVRLRHLLYDFFGGVYWALYIRKPTGRRPQIHPKKSYRKGCGFFAYSWKLPVYSGAFLLTVGNFSFTYSLSFFAYSFSFFAYSWSSLAYNGKVRASNKGLKGL